MVENESKNKVTKCENFLQTAMQEVIYDFEEK